MAAFTVVKSEFVRIRGYFSADKTTCHHTKVLRLSTQLLVPNIHIFAHCALGCYLQLVFTEVSSQKADNTHHSCVVGPGRWGGSGFFMDQHTHWRTLHVLTSSQGQRALTEPGVRPGRDKSLCRNVSSWVHLQVQTFSFWL